MNHHLFSCHRKIQVTDMDVRPRVEHLYICQELHSRVGYIMMKIMLPPTILSLSLGIIVCMYISIRHTDLPIYLYVIFPYIAFTLLLIIFWLSYDIALITRDFECIRGQLLSHQSPYLVHMSRHERKCVMMRATAMRVVEFPVGEFADFSLSMSVAVWEEVVNQVLFLLTF